MTISFIIPTIGRKSLKRTLSSIEKWEGDQIWVIQHFPPSGTWGNAERKEGIAKSTCDYIAFIDDDDYYTKGHRAIMDKASSENPGKPNLFKIKYPNGKILWDRKEIVPGNISSQMIMVPNKSEMFYRFQFPGNTNMGDYYFVARWKFPEVVFRQEIIAMMGHSDGERP